MSPFLSFRFGISADRKAREASMARAKSKSLAEQARFVFRGTVQKLRSATVRGVKPAERTAIVRVDEVIRAPLTLSDIAGHEITVDLAGRQKLTVGQQAVFHATGWIFGDSIAVQAIDHPPVDVTHAAMAAVAGDPVASLANHDARMRWDRAEVVVSGQVASIALPAAAVATAATAAGPGTGERFSEHVPLWRDAVIHVWAVHKGRHGGKKATVRFPASTDVMWHRAPKFQAGQEGFFMLHKGELAASTAARGMVTMTAVEMDRSYTALHPADFQPFDHSGGIRPMIDAEPSTAKRRPRRRER
jgi:hypothetical protein